MELKTILVFAVFVLVLEEELAVISFPIWSENLLNPPNSLSIQNLFFVALPEYPLSRNICGRKIKSIVPK